MPFLYLKNIGQETVIHLVSDSVKMKLRVGSFDKWAMYQVWKFGDYKSKSFAIQPTDTIIDIGGHIGSFSIWAAKQAHQGKVFTFEPNTENFLLLRENKELNQIANLEIFNLAVSDKIGEITLFNSMQQNMGHSIYESHLLNHTLVKTIPLDEILKANQIEKVDLLKVDAEGAEYPILLNASSHTLQKIDKIILEYHDYLNHEYTYQDIKNHLENNGFVVERKTSLYRQSVLKLGVLIARRIT
ncbi:MAG: FkbM family methyltransferase [Anaerolineales bacterium]|nr:FkbM family methyltransferase [Anaerolineales bacterium]